MKKHQLLFLFFIYCQSLSFGQLNIELVGSLEYAIELNDIWGYVAPDSTEYALVGTLNGVSIVSLAEPENPTQVAFVGGTNSRWRDLKTWGNHAYVTTEAADGLLIIDLSGLPNEVSHSFWNPTIEGEVDSFRTCHNLYIDENGFCYLSGSNLNNGGLLIADVFSNPDTPQIVGIGPAAYSHDIYVRDNIAYSSDIDDGVLTIHDVSDKSNIQLLSMVETPLRFTHNAWLSDDGNVVFTTEERPNAPTTAYDITDLSDIKELNQFIPAATANQGVIPHNVHYYNDFLVISHYGDGLIIVDATRPENLIEVGNYDTTPAAAAGFIGAWGAYPFLPSGLVLVSDIDNGLFVMRPNYNRAAFLEGGITDATTGDGIFGATITIDSLVSTTSGLRGEIQTGIAGTGTFEVTISQRGYLPQTVQVTLTEGEVTPINIALQTAPSAILFGSTTNKETGEPIGNVTLQLTDGDFTEQITSDSTGIFTYEIITGSNYNVVVGKWGFETLLIENFLVSDSEGNVTGASPNIELQPGIVDPFALDLGWTVLTENNFVGGGFELGVPVTTSDFPILTNDEIEDLGNSCYSTANSSLGIPNSVFLIGNTTLTSPTFDLSGMMTPTVSYSTLYANLLAQGQTGFVDGVDTMKVYLNNGTERVLIEAITNRLDLSFTVLPEWEESVIRVNDFLEPTSTMTIEFELFSDDTQSVSEAGVDNFRAFDAGTVSVRDYIKEDLSFAATPNPFGQQLNIQYNPSEWDKEPSFFIYNTLGKAVWQQAISPALNQSIHIPNTIQAGIYFIQLRNSEKASRVLKMVKH